MNTSQNHHLKFWIISWVLSAFLLSAGGCAGKGSGGSSDGGDSSKKFSVQNTQQKKNEEMTTSFANCIGMCDPKELNEMCNCEEKKTLMVLQVMDL